MKRVRNRTGRTFFVLLVPYLAILSVTLLASVLIFTSVGRRYTGETEKLRAEQVSQLAVELDYYFKYSINLGDSILMNPKLQLIARKDPLIYTNNDMRSDLVQADTQQCLTDIVVYLGAHDTMVTRGIQRNAEDYYKWYESLNGVSYEEFKSIYLQPSHMRKFMPPVLLKKNPSGQNMVIPYLQSTPLSLADGTPTAQIILYIDAKPIEAALRSFASDPFAHVYMVYDDGAVAMQTNGAPEYEMWESKNAGEWLLEGERYRAIEARLPSGAARIVTLSEHGAFYAEWNKMRQMTGIVIAVYVGLGVLAAVLLARMNYRPIREINALLGDKKGGNEYDRIKEAVATSITDRQTMNSIIEQQRPLVRAGYLLQLLNGPVIVEEKVKGHLKTLGISFEDKAFYVLLCEFDMQSKFFEAEEKVPDANLRCASIVLDNVGTELFSRSFEASFVAVGRGCVAFILAGELLESSEDILQKIVKNSDFLMAFAEREYDLDMTIGVSTGRSSVDELPQCHDEARYALNHGLMMRRGACVAYGELRPEETENYFYYPADTNLRLSGLMRAGEYEKACELIDALYEVNFGERNINVHAGRCFVYEVGTTVDRVLLGMMPEGGKDQALGEFLRKLGSDISFAEAKAQTLAYVEKCRVLAGQHSKGTTAQLVERITLYIDSSDSGIWLDLNVLADEFKVTPQYISHIFKKYTKENVKDYISRRKLAEAKRYLCETDMTGDAISRKIGYSSEAGLIRLFKKYEHTTPSLYRQASRS